MDRTFDLTLALVFTTLALLGSRVVGGGGADFLYLACIRSRSVVIKLDSLSQHEYDTTTVETMSDCLEHCANSESAALALFLDTGWCTCILQERAVIYRPEDITFKIFPSDLSSECVSSGEEAQNCYIGSAQGVSVYCNQQLQYTQEQGGDVTFCDIIGSATSFTDPAWLANDFDLWEDYMNDFPKCVGDEYIQVWEPSHALSTSDPATDIIADCRALSGSAKYFMMKPIEGEDDTMLCIPAQDISAFTIPDYVNNGIVLNGDCRPCPRASPRDPNWPSPSYDTCGFTNAVSIYCNSAECRRFENNGQFYSYFGCMAKNLDWSEDQQFYRGEFNTLEKCIQNCSGTHFEDDKETRQSYNIIIAVQHLNHASEEFTSVECRCYSYTEHIANLSLTSRQAVDGCELGWGPPIGGPAGSFDEQWLKYVLYCHQDICPRILNTYVDSPSSQCCDPAYCPTTLDPNSPSSPSSVSTSTTPSTQSPSVSTELTNPSTESTTSSDTSTASTSLSTSTASTSLSTSSASSTASTSTSTTSSPESSSTSTSTVTTSAAESSTASTSTSTGSSSSSALPNPPTESTTSPEISTFEPCQGCQSRFDERGFFWQDTCAGEVREGPFCPENNGVAFWYCDPKTLDFVPRQPNRLDCSTIWIDQVVEDSHTVNADPKYITTTILKNIGSFQSTQDQVSSGSLVKLIQVGFSLVDRMCDPENQPTYAEDVTNAMGIVQDYVQIVGDLFHHHVAWQEDDEEPMTRNATRLLKSAENLAFFLLGNRNELECSSPDSTLNEIIADSRAEVTLFVSSMWYSDNQTLLTPPYIELDLNHQDVKNLRLPTWRSVGLAYQNVFKIFDQLFSPKLNNVWEKEAHSELEFRTLATFQTFSFNEWTPLPQELQLKVSFPHDNASLGLTGPRFCVFWDEESFLWSERGCYLSVESSASRTVCVCNHTTNFAVLFDITGALDDLPELTLKVLNVLSTILCVISAVASLLTFIILFSSKLPSSPRTVIQENRAVSLFFLYLLFLLGIDPNVLGLPNWLCRGVAIAIHFFGLTSFFWTSLEGIQLYRALVSKRLSDDDGRFFRLLRFVAGYGVPLVIVFLTLAVQFILEVDNAYDHENDDSEQALCWLQENTFIWAFVGPALAVILVNIVILIRTARVVFRAQKRLHQGGWAELLGHLKSWTILSFLLGITWASGLLINGRLALYGAYLFVILNGSVGLFTFVHSVCLNPSVLGELKIRLGFWNKKDFNLNRAGTRADAMKQFHSQRPSLGLALKNKSRRREFVEDDHSVVECSSPDNISLPNSDSSSSGVDIWGRPKHLQARVWARPVSTSPTPPKQQYALGRRKSCVATLAGSDRWPIARPKKNPLPMPNRVRTIDENSSMSGPTQSANYFYGLT